MMRVSVDGEYRNGNSYTQATWAEQWVWGLQDYRQLLKDAGMVPSLQYFAAWMLSRTMNYANVVQGTQNL